MFLLEKFRWYWFHELFGLTNINRSNIELTQTLVPTIGIILLLISIISLYLSYIKYSSDVWKSTFHGLKGLWLELGRICLIIGTNIYFLVVVFGNETSEFFHLGVPTITESASLHISYAFASILFILGLYALVWLHFFKGPNILAEIEKHNQVVKIDKSYWTRFKKRRDTTNNYFNRYEYPYLCYFPYSFINLIVLGISNTSISLYAFLKSWKTLENLKTHFITVLESTNNVAQHDIIFKAFELFCLKFIEIAGIYSSLFCWLAIAIAYEVLFAWITLSQMGRLATVVAYLTGSTIWISVIILGFNFYGEIYRKAEYKLLGLNAFELVKGFQEHYRPKVLFNRILDDYTFFYVPFIIIFIIIPLYKLLQKLLTN